jgi:uncharacterized protein
MKRILIVSTEQHAGKSLLALALGKSLQERGMKTAYMKPISFEVSYATGEPVDRDADAIRSLLSLEDDSLRDIAPVPLEGTFLRETIESGDRGFRKKIQTSFERISQDRDIALIEGRSYLGLGASAGLSDPDLAEMLDADVLLITNYDGEEAIDRILCALRMFEGPTVMGVILKDVPMDRSFNMLSEVLVSFLASRGAEVLGIVPQDHNLRTVNTDEIVKRLGGRLLTDPSIERQIRHFAISAMGPEESMRLFRRTPDLAVITGGDREDIHRASFEVPSLRCLIVTGLHRPTREIIDLANERQVPIILAGQNTMITATLCEEMLDRAWIRPGPALDYAMDYVRYNIDIDRIVEKAQDR